MPPREGAPAPSSVRRRGGSAGEAAYLGLGTNLGDRRDHLRRALSHLVERARVEAVSSVYETDPVGIVDQPRFLNMAVRCTAPLDPRQWVEVCMEIERAMGRARSHRNAPRIIDLDVLLVGDRVVDEPDVEVPHPRMTERPFVLVPLLELDPALTHPRTGRPFQEWVPAAAAESRGVDRVMSGQELLDER